MLYAALGDSITYGYCSTSDDATYVSRIKLGLTRGQPVNLYLHAKPGWTSSQLLKSLRKVPECIWAESRLITLMIGGNDLLKATPWLLDAKTQKIIRISEKLADNLTEIIQLIKRPQSKIIIGTIYNPFPNSLLVQEHTDRINRAIRQVVKRENLLLADVSKNFHQKESMYIDGFKRGSLRDFKLVGNPIHPNDAGHEAIAQVYLRVYRQSLTKTKAGQQKGATIRQKLTASRGRT